MTPIISFIKIQEAFPRVSSVYNRNNVTIIVENVKKQKLMPKEIMVVINASFPQNNGTVKGQQIII